MNITNGYPDPETEMTVVIRIALGAGETAMVRSALAWGIPERRPPGNSENSGVDRYWTRHNTTHERDGHSRGMLHLTRWALERSLADTPQEELLRRKNIGDAISLLSRALRASESAKKNLGPVASRWT